MNENTGPLDRQNLERLMKTLLDNQEMMEASMKPLAQLLYSKLSALTAAGFSREEAMELIKARGLGV